MMKNLLIATPYRFLRGLAFFAFTLYLVTGCGLSEQKANIKTQSPSEKPIKITQDEATSAYAIFLVAAINYLHTATREAVVGGSQIGCQRVMSRQGLPEAFDKIATQARVAVEVKCDHVQGDLEIAYNQIRLLPSNDKNLRFRFERGTVTNFEPLRIQGPGQREPTLLAQFQLNLELIEPAANTYRFDLKGMWQTPSRRNNRDRKTKVEWQLLVSGQIEATGKADQGVTLGELVVNGQGGYWSPTLIESSTFNASAAAQGTQATNMCGIPQTEWASVYTTTLFPDEPLNLNFLTHQARLQNTTTGRAYNLAPCRPHAWASNSSLALKIFERARSK